MSDGRVCKYLERPIFSNLCVGVGPRGGETPIQTSLQPDFKTPSDRSNAEPSVPAATAAQQRRAHPQQPVPAPAAVRTAVPAAAATATRRRSLSKRQGNHRQRQRQQRRRCERDGESIRQVPTEHLSRPRHAPRRPLAALAGHDVRGGQRGGGGGKRRQRPQPQRWRQQPGEDGQQQFNSSAQVGVFH